MPWAHGTLPRLTAPYGRQLAVVSRMTYFLPHLITARLGSERTLYKRTRLETHWSSYL